MQPKEEKYKPYIDLIPYENEGEVTKNRREDFPEFESPKTQKRRKEESGVKGAFKSGVKNLADTFTGKDKREEKEEFIPAEGNLIYRS